MRSIPAMIGEYLRDVLLTVLETGKSKSEMPINQHIRLFSASRVDSFCCWALIRHKKKRSQHSETSFIRPWIPFIKGNPSDLITSQSPHVFMPSPWTLGCNMCLGGTYSSKPQVIDCNYYHKNINHCSVDPNNVLLMYFLIHLMYLLL
jgi:hypothetical protein